MKIKFTNYSDGIHELDFVKSAEELELVQPFIGNVKLFCRMDKSPGQLVLDCSVKAEAQLNCDRCLSEFVSEFEKEFEIVYLVGNESGEDDDTVRYLKPDSDKVDLTQDTVDYAKLALPMKVLCREDCKGLCPVCGVDFNESECNCEKNDINPVWEPLLKLKQNKN